MIMYPINFHHKINGGFQQGLHFNAFSTLLCWSTCCFK